MLYCGIFCCTWPPAPDRAITMSRVELDVIWSPCQRGRPRLEIASTTLHRSSLRTWNTQAIQSRSSVHIVASNISLIRIEDNLLPWSRQVTWGKYWIERGLGGVPQAWSKVRQCVGTVDHIPDPHAFVVANCDEVLSVFAPGKPVGRAIVRPAAFSPASSSACPIVTSNANCVIHVQHAQATRASTDIPDTDCAIAAATHKYVLIPGMPCCGENRSRVTRQRVRA